MAKAAEARGDSVKYNCDKEYSWADEPQARWGGRFTKYNDMLPAAALHSTNTSAGIGAIRAEGRPPAVKADCRYTTRSCEGPVVKTQPATEKNGARPAECEQETRGEQPHMTQNGYPKSSARPRADLDRDR